MVTTPHKDLVVPQLTQEPCVKKFPPSLSLQPASNLKEFPVVFPLSPQIHSLIPFKLKKFPAVSQTYHSHRSIRTLDYTPARSFLNPNYPN